jgi:hypothetical protein
MSALLHDLGDALLRNAKCKRDVPGVLAQQFIPLPDFDRVVENE